MSRILQYCNGVHYVKVGGVIPPPPPPPHTHTHTHTHTSYAYVCTPLLASSPDSERVWYTLTAHACIFTNIPGIVYSSRFTDLAMSLRIWKF